VVRSTPFHSVRNPDLNVTYPIRLVYHGVANKERGLDKMIESVQRAGSDFSLDMYLVGNEKIISELKDMSDGNPLIRILPPVEFSKINEMLTGYDIGFVYVQPTVFNYRYGLPNKLFEFIQARLAVVSGPSPEIASVIESYECGVSSKEFSVESMVSLLKGLKVDDIIRMKNASNRASSELCWEVESKILSDMIDRSLLGNVMS
jgi:hypothetical protein